MNSVLIKIRYLVILILLFFSCNDSADISEIEEGQFIAKFGNSTNLEGRKVSLLSGLIQLIISIPLYSS